MDLLNIHRFVYTDNSTIGDLYFGPVFETNTLELSCRKPDEKGLYAIAPGRYQVKFDYSPKYKRKMPFLFNEFTGRSGTKRPDKTDWLRTDIMFHPANWPSDLDGCIGVGTYSPEAAADFIASSRKAFDRLCEKLDAYKDEEIFLSITGGHPHSSARTI